MSVTQPTDRAAKQELAACPWCKAKPRVLGHYHEIFHRSTCFLAEGDHELTRKLIQADKFDAWNTRAHSTLAAENAQRRESHPEDYCHKCGGPNVVWFAPNTIWDRAVRDANEPGILCPTCFIQLAEAAGFYGVWKVALHDQLKQGERKK
jgi:hypothetical protein